MSAAWSAAGDFDPQLCGIMRAAGALLDQARDAMHGMSGPEQGSETRAAGTRMRARPPGPAGRAVGAARRTVGTGLRIRQPGGMAWWLGGQRVASAVARAAGGPGSPGRPAGRRPAAATCGPPSWPCCGNPRNGYQIMSEIEERSDGAWRPSPGAVYPALQLLADEGLIAGEESGGRRTFSLTEAGRRHIEDDPEAARPAWEAMAQDGPGEMPGLFAQAARLGGSIVQLAHAGTPEQIRAAERLLEQTRRRMYQILASDGPADDDDADGDAVGDPDDE